MAAGCGSDDEDAGTATTTAGDEGGVEVTDVWARTSPAAAETGAIYMTLTSAVDDALVGAEVPSDIAGVTEVHETVAAEEAGGDEGSTASTEMDMGDESTTTMGDEGDGAMEDDAMGGDDMDMGGMTMREVARIPLPAGEAVALEPGGYHVMLLELAAPLTAGQTFPVTLTFEEGGTQEVQVEVRDDAP